MTKEKIKISRRSVLGGLGAVGLTSAGAGLGTTAYLSDGEGFSGNAIGAGELDLKVDWEEHYYDGSSGGDLVHFSDPGEGYMGFPDPDNAHVWVAKEAVPALMDATAIEAFPDPDGDGSQEVTYEGFTYNACEHGADLPADLMPHDALATRTDNDDTMVDGEPAPLVNLRDVKPGDFGELTLSFHLCDSPGYIWLQAANVSQSENEILEPESEVDESPENAELAEQIQTVWWYDSRGDNILQTNCEEKLYLSDSGPNPTKLFEVTLTGTAAELEEIWPAGGTGDSDFNQTDAIATTPNGSQIVLYDKNSGHLGTFEVAGGSFSDDGLVSGDPGGVVLAGYSPSGTLWAASQDTNQLYTVDRSGPSVTAQGNTGIDLAGADLVFASDGTLYIWTASDAQRGLYKVDDPSSDTTATPVDSSNIGNADAQITGLAIRDNGTGDIVASDRSNDDIVVIDRTDGSITNRYSMMEDGSAYTYDYGDMTAGRYCGEVFRRGNLAEDLGLLSAGNGIPLDGNLASSFDELGSSAVSASRECFVPGVSHYIGFAWWLPETVGNEVQSDSVSFDLGFYAEQCRHNDGSGPSTT